jgi:hypothetical protein
MARRQQHDLTAAGVQVLIAEDKQRRRSLLNERREGRIDFAFISRAHRDELQPQSARSRLGLVQFQLGIRIVRVQENRDG